MRVRAMRLTSVANAISKLFGMASLNLDFKTGMLDPRITFSRASTGTYFDKTGTLVSAPVNLLTYSSDFYNNAWSKTSSFIQTNLLTYSEQFDNAIWNRWQSSITANATTAPDGAISADKLVENSTSNSHNIGQFLPVVAGSIYTYSVFVKAAERTKVVLVSEANNGAFTNASVVFDLILGSATVISGSPVSYTVKTVGNGWYRCSITATAIATANGTFSTGPFTSGVIYTGDGASGLYIWGAQLVQGAAAGDYVSTTAAISMVGYLAPNGLLSAKKIIETSANSDHNISQGYSLGINKTCTYSLFAKSAERSQLTLEISNDVTESAQAGFNLSLGTVDFMTPPGTDFTGTTAAINAIGGGWYRCSITVNKAAINSTVDCYAYIRNGMSRSYKGDGTSGLYIWGAQLEIGSVATSYIPTISVVASGPRFGYNPITKLPLGLLIESQSTNLLTYSEQFDNAAWGKNGASVAVNSAIAPSGVASADTLIEDATSTAHMAFQSLSVTSGISISASCFVKQLSTNRHFSFIFDNNTLFSGNYPYASFNLSTGVIASSAIGTASITPVGGGWYRCCFVVTPTTSGISNLQCRLQTSSTLSGPIANYTGDGTSGIYIWGAQLEAGSLATSYIPTVATQVTRAADMPPTIAGSSFSSWFNPSEGTIYVDVTALALPPLGSFPNIANLSDGTNNNKIFIGYLTNNVGGAEVVVDGVSQVGIYPIITTLNRKGAFSYKANNFAISYNGADPSIDTSGSMPIVNQLSIGIGFNGYIGCVVIFPRCFSGDVLKRLTA